MRISMSICSNIKYYIILTIVVFLPIIIQAQEPPIVGEIFRFEEPIVVSAPAGSNPAEVIWSQTLGMPGALWTRVHFQRYDFSDDPSDRSERGRLEFSVGDEISSVSYYGQGPELLLTRDGFWSHQFNTDQVTLTLYGDPQQSVEFVIDRFMYGIEPYPSRELALDCLFDAKCLPEISTHYIKAKTVAYLLIEYSKNAYQCTGFLYKLPDDANPDQNKIMTASHCFPNSYAAESIIASFM